MRQGHILLVDDDEDDQMLFEDAIRQIDPMLKFRVANNGLEAIETLRKDAEQPAIIFLDMNMPKMDGCDCLAEIKQEEHLNDIPVVIYTTTNVPSQKERIMQLGPRHFFTKPTDYSVLISELKRIITAELDKKD